MTPAPVQTCWNRIGVFGNKSCSELPRQVHCRNCPTFAQAALELLDREPPPGYADEWTRLLAREKEANLRLSEVALVFRLAAEWLALPGACCLEVISHRPVRRLPLRSNSTLAGLVSVRGEILLSFSLAKILGLEGAPSLERRALPRLIVTVRARSKFVLGADEVDGLRRYAPEMIETLPATNAHALGRYTRGILTLEERKIGLLDDRRLFDALEKVLT
jgi:chemotaxis-related protein WspD